MSHPKRRVASDNPGDGTFTSFHKSAFAGDPPKSLPPPSHPPPAPGIYPDASRCVMVASYGSLRLSYRAETTMSGSLSRSSYRTDSQRRPANVDKKVTILLFYLTYCASISVQATVVAPLSPCLRLSSSDSTQLSIQVAGCRTV